MPSRRCAAGGGAQLQAVARDRGAEVFGGIHRRSAREIFREIGAAIAVKIARSSGRRQVSEIESLPLIRQPVAIGVGGMEGARREEDQWREKDEEGRAAGHVGVTLGS